MFLIFLLYIQNKNILIIMSVGVDGIKRKLEIIGCQSNGSHSSEINKLHGSIYLETTASLIWSDVGDNANQNSPILENEGSFPSINKCTS